MMECGAAADLVARWQAGDRFTTEETLVFAKHLAACPSCRAAYGALVPLLERDAGEREAAADPGLPTALEDRIMDAIPRLPAPRRAARAKPRTPLWAAAAAAVLVVAVGVGLGLRARAGAYLTVSFVLDTPGARTVAVVGDFTEWQTTGYELSRRASDGKWEITMRLRRDRSYTYGFVIDGERWIPDPGAPETVDDGFGGVNSILRL
jgi:predicted anti-sigma-YlaC factor YlaD